MIKAPHQILDQAKVISMADALKRGESLPIILVVDMGSYYQAIEGTHRLEAYHQAGIRPQTRLLDVNSLVEHDKRAVERLLTVCCGKVYKLLDTNK